ncbi:MAG TPA: penicillin-binding protein 2, partial [Gaiellaceae bacterium]
MKRVVNSRIRLLLLATLLVFGALLARAAWIATVRAAPLAAMAQAQTKATVTLPAGRGTIFDAVGTPLALGEQATTVYADPRQVRNAHAEAVVAARILGLKPKVVERAISDRSLGFVYVERKAPPDKATALAKHKLPGFGFYGEERRTYPQASVAAQVLGFAGVDNNGLAGLELELNSDLTGLAGHETLVRDPIGRPISVQSVQPARQGKDVFLTIDHTIQANAEQVLRATLAKFHAKDATAIVLDPRTGGVLAMATAPGYNANNFSNVSPSLAINHAISDVYEPGSVFKVVTIGGALADHLVTPHTSFLLPYSIRVADRVVHDAEVRPTERMTVSQILQRSSNVGAVTIARTKLGESRLKSWIARFGFGEKTGIDFPGET